MSETIWRYLPDQKFKWLLADLGIYFAKTNKFEDELEGFSSSHYSAATVEAITNSAEQRDKAERLHQGMIRSSQESTYVCSWHKNETESLEMWNKYAHIKKGNFGVAIKSTTFAFLLSKPESLYDVIEMKDCKYDQDESTPPSPDVFFHKNKENWSHENEFRLIINSINLYLKTGLNLDNHNLETCSLRTSLEPTVPPAKSVIFKKDENGLVVKFDLNKIIDEIYVSPNSSQEYYNSVQRSLSENGIHSAALKSSIRLL